jgi:hypothetical protein
VDLILCDRDETLAQRFGILSHKDAVDMFFRGGQGDVLVVDTDPDDPPNGARFGTPDSLEFTVYTRASRAVSP